MVKPALILVCGKAVETAKQLGDAYSSGQMEKTATEAATEAATETATETATKSMEEAVKEKAVTEGVKLPGKY